MLEDLSTLIHIKCNMEKWSRIIKDRAQNVPDNDGMKPYYEGQEFVVDMFEKEIEMLGRAVKELHEHCKEVAK